MPLLPAPLKERLVEVLAIELEAARVYGGRFLLKYSLRAISESRTLPDKGDVAEKLRAYIGDDPLYTFVTDELDAMFRTFEGAEPREAPLSAFEGFHDLRAVSQDLVDRLDSLPRHYWLTLTFPRRLGEQLAAAGDIELSPRHRLVIGRTIIDSFEEPMPARRGLEALAMNQRHAPGLNPNASYFQVRMTGYLGGEPTEPFFSARDDVISFLGLGTALGLFTDCPRPWEQSRVPPYWVHEEVDGRWRSRASKELDRLHADALGELGLCDDNFNADEIRNRLDRIGSVFRMEARNLTLSAKWLFDSYCGHDMLLRFIQASVSIEILLGDEDADPEIGLTKLMANRFAYSIAKTPAARRELVEQFREIYKVRSKIVHRGKNRLTRGDQRNFRNLQAFCCLLIGAEQRLVQHEENVQGKKLGRRDD